MGRVRGTPAELPDQQLVLAFQHGDDGSFDAIYRRYKDRVRHTCMRMLGNEQEAEEATQETFMRAYRPLGRFNGQYQLGAWLVRIASNVCVDILRARARTVRLAETPVDEIELPGDDLVAEKIEDQDSLRHALADIQPLHAEALYLRAVEGMSHQEMAGRLAMTPQQVKSLLHRSRNSFKRAFEKVSVIIGAPLASLRGLSSRTRDTNVQTIATVSPSFAPLMERVATGALVAVVAASGAATVVETPADEPNTIPRVVAQDSNVTEGAAQNARSSSSPDVAKDPADEGAPVAAKDVKDKATEPVRDVQGRVKDQMPDDDEEDVAPLPSHDSAASTLSKETRKVAEKARGVRDRLDDKNDASVLAE